MARVRRASSARASQYKKPATRCSVDKRGQVGEGLVTPHLAVAVPDAPTAGEVVHPQGRRVRAGHRLRHDAVASEEGDQERQRRDQVRRVLEQTLALRQVLVHEAELTLLEVAEAAVHHLRRLGRGARGEVGLFDERRAQAAAGGVQRHARSGDPPAHDEDVELLVRESAQRVGTSEGVHRPSLPHPSGAQPGVSCRRGSRPGAAPSGSAAGWRVGVPTRASCPRTAPARRPGATRGACRPR